MCLSHPHSLMRYEQAGRARPGAVSPDEQGLSPGGLCFCPAGESQLALFGEEEGGLLPVLQFPVSWTP